MLEIDKVEEGMVLYEPVTNNFGQTLLSSGTELTQKHINMLKMWSISEINITTGDDKPQEESSISQELLEMARKTLDARMSWKPKNEMEEELVQLALESIVKNSGKRFT